MSVKKHLSLKLLSHAFSKLHSSMKIYIVFFTENMQTGTLGGYSLMKTFINAFKIGTPQINCKKTHFLH